jgi:hypothetical protein
MTPNGSVVYTEDRRFTVEGVKLYRGDGVEGMEKFHRVGIVSVTFGGGERAEIDVTETHDDTAQFRLGIRRNPNITLNGNLKPGDPAQIGLRYDRDQSIDRNFRLEWPDGNIVDITALVRSFVESAAGTDQAITFSSEWRVNTYDYRNAAEALTISSIDPGTGEEETEVTITGTNMQTAFAVYFGETEAHITAKEPDGTEIKVEAPIGETGTVDIRVVNAVGGVVEANAFEYTV